MSAAGAHPGDEVLAALADEPTGGAPTGGAPPRVAGGAHPAGVAGAPAGDPGGPAGADPELAAVAEHVDRCERCRDQVALLRAATRALAQLPEPELPPGLHDRLIAAVDAERRAAGAGAQAGRPLAAATAGTRDAAGDAAGTPHDTGHDAAGQARHGGAWQRLTVAGGGAASRRRARRWLGWSVGAAATLVLAVASISQISGTDSALSTFGQGGGQAQEDAASGPATLAAPAATFDATGDYDLERLRDDLASRPDMRAAYGAAVAAARRSAVPPALEANPTDSGQGSAQPDVTPELGQRSGQGVARDDFRAACETAAPTARAALVIRADYRGQPAVLFVTVKGEPPEATLRAYARDGCAPLGVERGTVPPP